MTDELAEIAQDFSIAIEDFLGDVRDSWWDAERLVRIPAARRAVTPTATALVVALFAVAASAIGAVVNVVLDLLGAAFDLVLTIVGATLAAIVAIVLGFVFGSADVRRNVFRSIATRLIGVGNALNYFGTFLGDLAQGFVDRGVWWVVREYRLTRCEVGQGIARLRQAAAQKVPTLSRGDRSTAARRLDHFLVLMLENRSFDHLLGQNAGWDGLIPPQPAFSNRCERISYPAGGNARPTLRADPPHEFSAVARQLRDDEVGSNAGFMNAYREHMISAGEGTAQPGDCRGNLAEDPREVMRGFSEKRLPVLYALAREFAVCDAWFSSVPGPTMPNRLFAMAGTSGGLADSPSNASLARAVAQGGFRFSAGSLFEQLSDMCVRWRIYAGSFPPMSLALRGVVEDQAHAGWPLARSLKRLATDLANADADFPAFVFIEPNYGPTIPRPDFSKGNSQHPLDGVSGGEALIKEVYEALRTSPIWSSSMLLIVYDEHGGFYDHQIPPPATAPGGRERYRTWQTDPAAKAFDFDRLGVRVPAVVVSPLVARGDVDHVIRDHASIIATLAEVFGTSRLTDRGRDAPSLANLLTYSLPRDTPAVLPNVFYAPGESKRG